MREWRLVRNAQKLQRHSSELVSGATDSIRRKAARARDMLPSRQSDANDHAINDDANNDIGDEFDEDFVPEEVENRRRVTKARSRRRESAMNASIIRDADDFTDSIRRKAARARDMLPSRQSDANDHAINDDANNDIGDEFDEDFVPEEVENRRRVTKARSRRRESAMNASIIRDADDFINEVEIENNLRWKEYAVLVDDVSRFWFPFVYVIAVSIVLAQAK